VENAQDAGSTLYQIPSPDAQAGKFARGYFDLAGGRFRVGSATSYFYFDGTDAKFTGKLAAASIETGSIKSNDAYIAMCNAAETEASLKGFVVSSAAINEASPSDSQIMELTNLYSLLGSRVPGIIWQSIHDGTFTSLATILSYLGSLSIANQYLGQSLRFGTILDPNTLKLTKSSANGYTDTVAEFETDIVHALDYFKLPDIEALTERSGYGTGGMNKKVLFIPVGVFEATLTFDIKAGDGKTSRWIVISSNDPAATSGTVLYDSGMFTNSSYATASITVTRPTYQYLIFRGYGENADDTYYIRNVFLTGIHLAAQVVTD
jgi:hypothetical protein